jgi:hypothetical protein
MDQAGRVRDTPIQEHPVMLPIDTADAGIVNSLWIPWTQN